MALGSDDHGALAARLCDVFPGTGEARLVSHGVRNLNRGDDMQLVELEMGRRCGEKRVLLLPRFPKLA